MSDILALIPSSQDDWYNTISMTERQAAESVADWARDYLEYCGVACRDYHGSTNSAGDSARRAVADGCNHFISLHFDAGTPSTGGLGLYDLAGAIQFTQHILQNYCNAMNQPNRGVSHRGRPDGAHPWPSVLTTPSDAGFGATATLIELGTMTVENDISEIKDPAWRKRCGEAIAKAYMSWIGIAEQDEGDDDVMLLNAVPKAMQSGKYVQVITEAFFSLKGGQESYRCYLILKNETDVDTPVTVELFGTPSFAVAQKPFTMAKWERKVIDVKGLYPAGYDGGLSLTIKSSADSICGAVSVLKG